MRVPTIFLALLAIVVSFCSANPCEPNSYTCACCQSICDVTSNPSVCFTQECTVICFEG
ncbi:hypothetical protein EJ03DRAFT_329603 [Teratosphaeria nubilosa]|uniref:Uncharacterized protein n=1 Tax=Teratosphaeria nubilosa TaxID=161662 RepID=A0A6G1L3X6_9PEZI|nr:hypothetical protein EJ03DRAFT_329603 [Teratosphaeria nubilosa]